MKYIKFVLMYLLFSLLLSILISSGSEVAADDFKKTKIAVLDFQQQGKFEIEDIGKFAAEWLTTSLVETGRFDIVERRLLQKLLEEQKIGISGVIDQNSASKLGKVLGVKTVVTGTVLCFGGIIEINARLISVETGSIIAAEKIKSASTIQLSELISKIAEKIALAFPLSGYVVQRLEDKVIIDLGRRNGVKPGMRFLVFKEGRVIKHPKTGEVLDVETITIGELNVTDTKEKTSTAVIVKEANANAVKYGYMVRYMLRELGDEYTKPPLVVTMDADNPTVTENKNSDSPRTKILAGYKSIVIKDFVVDDAVLLNIDLDDKDEQNEFNELKTSMVSQLSSEFANQLNSKKLFDTVRINGLPMENSAIVEGKFTLINGGNAAKRIFFGAFGKSEVKIHGRIVDGATGKEITTFNFRRSSPMNWKGKESVLMLNTRENAEDLAEYIASLQ
ncbi:MAG: hypothetical protein A2X82_20015 [Geobacteraceae bacterium GWC2_55_20]|nr:MAG: hypothetical protein A2X82_20015 [Geobacteraceae bacterium GWC2_55_20]HCE69638.1 hypothetical protein [Geobacter sp.]